MGYNILRTQYLSYILSGIYKTMGGVYRSTLLEVYFCVVTVLKFKIMDTVALFAGRWGTNYPWVGWIRTRKSISRNARQRISFSLLFLNISYIIAHKNRFKFFLHIWIWFLNDQVVPAIREWCSTRCLLWPIFPDPALWWQYSIKIELDSLTYFTKSGTKYRQTYRSSQASDNFQAKLHESMRLCNRFSGALNLQLHSVDAEYDAIIKHGKVKCCVWE